MKKITALVLTLILAVALTACGNDNKDDASSKKDNNSNKTSQNSDQAKQIQDMQKNIKKGMLDDSKTVATVNGKKIKGTEYNLVYQSVAQQLYMGSLQQGQKADNSKIQKQAKQQTLDSLVGQELILQDADKKGIKASDDEVSKQYDKTAEQYGGKDKLKTALEKQKMTTDDLKKNLQQSIVFNKYVDKEIDTPKVTDKEIKDFYDQYSQNQKDAPKLEKVKPQIKQQLEQQKKSKAVMDRVDQLKKDGSVDIKI